jgi:hypothetical protein
VAAAENILTSVRFCQTPYFLTAQNLPARQTVEIAAVDVTFKNRQP